MRKSKNAIIKHCFPSSEPDSKKRPETVRSYSEDDECLKNHAYIAHISFHVLVIFQVVTQFKNSLVGLTEILMSKEPWYVRCVKPNEAKQPGETLCLEEPAP